MAGDTRERIIDAAIELMSERGSRRVTTNHIAEAAGISPGNLYYHFRSKEEIVLAIYERAIAEYSGLLSSAAAVTPDPFSMLLILDGVFAHQWKYRCIQREMPVLVRADDAFAARYREMQVRRTAFFRGVIERWIADGYVVPLSTGEVDDVVIATWLVGESWLSYLDATGRGADESESRRGARLVYALLKPHLTAKALSAFEGSIWVA